MRTISMISFAHIAICIFMTFLLFGGEMVFGLVSVFFLLLLRVRSRVKDLLAVHFFFFHLLFLLFFTSCILLCLV